MESYSHLIDEVQSELQHHIANVENLKDVMQMQIDHNRNRIISLISRSASVHSARAWAPRSAGCGE